MVPAVGVSRPVRPAARVRRSWACVAFTLAVPVATAGAEVSVPLRIAEPAGVARRTMPVTTGVPLPRGAVRDPARLWMSDARGAAIPSQTTALERWPDGSVRWVLVDTLADVAGGGEAVYVLRQGASPRPRTAPRLRLQQTPGGTVIDTGALRVAVPANGGALATEVDLGGRRIAGQIPLPALVVEGAPERAPISESPRVETDGPVRSELLLRGRWPDGVTYEARLAAFAGQPMLRLRYTLTNTSDAPVLRVRRLGVSAPGTFTAGALGVGGDARRFAPLTGAHALRQADPDDAQLDRAGAGGRADCWVEGSD